jgi:hypothetical protein
MHCHLVNPRWGQFYCCQSVNRHRFLGIQENTYLKLSVREEQVRKTEMRGV